jgi:hypothetical protein
MEIIHSGRTSPPFFEPGPTGGRLRRTRQTYSIIVTPWWITGRSVQREGREEDQGETLDASGKGGGEG